MQNKNLRSHDLAVELYQQAKESKIPRQLKDQLVRSSSSIALNLNEGWGRRSENDRMHFFNMALGSLREVQSIIKLEKLDELHSTADHLGACLYKLTRSKNLQRSFEI